MAVSGSLKKGYSNSHISNDLAKILSMRKDYLEESIKKFSIIDETMLQCSYAISPIIVDGDVAGAVIILAVDCAIGANDLKISQMAAGFLSNYLE